MVFLYISIDDKAELWKKAISDDRIEGIHLLSTGGFKSPVAEAFNIMGIPRYIIIGRDGKIFDQDAPRPSEDITPDENQGSPASQYLNKGNNGPHQHSYQNIQ